MPKIYAIESGGDWADASVEFVVFDSEAPGMFEALVSSWKEYQQDRNEAIRANDLGGADIKVPKYIPLETWLLNNGGRRPTEEELEVYYDE